MGVSENWVYYFGSPSNRDDSIWSGVPLFMGTTV